MRIRRVLAGAALGLAGSALLALPAAGAVPADPYGPAPTPVGLAVSSTTVGPGGTVVVSGTGFAPDSAVAISTSVTAGFARVAADAGSAPLGELLRSGGTRAVAPSRFAGCVDSCVVTAGSSGAFSVGLTLTRTGANVITASGIDPSGGSLVLSATVVVAAAGGVGGPGAGNGSGAGSGGSASGVGGLPNTGSDVRLPALIGGALILLGGGAVVLGRRRRRGGIAA